MQNDAVLTMRGIIKQFPGTLALNKIYMSPESVAARQAKIYSEFSQYVSSYNVSGSDEDAVAKWPGNDEYTTILIYRDEELNLPAGSGRVPAGQTSSNANRLLPLLKTSGENTWL